MKALILGGARSGKSAFAEKLACETGKKLVYIATGQAKDDEMAERIRHHQASRGERWQLHEEPLNLASAIRQYDQPDTAVLVDCLTLWMSNCLLKGDIAWYRDELLQVVQDVECDVFLVSNEVGSGVVPLGELSRQFVDHSGWMHQALGKICERVTLVVAGLPLSLKE